MLQNGNKRIAINTVIIYIRLIVVTLVSLFVTRYVLKALGVSDFGLYNVVASLITMLNVVSVAMHTTTRRYINIEMAQANGNPNRIFNICLILHVLFAFAIFIIAETIGVWYINHYLNVQPHKLADAHFVFQISTLVACLGILNVPYQGLLEAFEKFAQVALIDITSATLKVIAIIILLHYEGNSLRFYSISICTITFLSFVFYYLACHYQYRSIIRRWRQPDPMISK